MNAAFLLWLQTVVAVAPVVTAEPKPPVDHFGFELRTGAEIPRGYPTVGAYISVGVGGDWSVGAGYEAVRTLGVTTPKSCETNVTPAIAASVRLGLWRHYRLPYHFSLRGGFLLGVAAPALSVGPFPDGSGGVAGDAAIDLEAGWSFHALEVAVYAQPTYAFGSITTSQMCPGVPDHVGVSEVGMQLGFGLSVRL